MGSATETQNHLLFLRDTNALPLGIADVLLAQVEDFRPALIKLHATVIAKARGPRSSTNSRNT